MSAVLTGQEVSEAVGGLGWRLLLDSVRTSVAVESLAAAAEVVARAVEVCGGEGERHLAADVRPRQVLLSLQSPWCAGVTGADIALARGISAAVGGLGLRTVPQAGAGALRSVQVLEIAVDAADIAAVRPFWKAVLGYGDAAGADGPADAPADGPEDPLADPVGQGPSLWFQQMEPVRVGRNRIHLDVSVPHDEALRRVGAALAAGGRMVSADRAPAFWVLADCEGNEVCVSTWQGRDG
ncbi:VOC family protein [Streptomyces spororaveus]|uniref:VOC family protein n=1 Tax=Streptomyces spororaveus TaxID=284039 RepID=UPI0031D9D507